ncbi:MAG: AraC family transcriptional regulator [Clostridiaceae bacterium]|nr:AraC family transcriptional regulator [Clostridiaceae bacterium]
MNRMRQKESAHLKPNLQAHFSFSIGNTIGVSSDSRKLHWHNELEICRVKQGTGKYLINGHEYFFEPGDVFIINNDEIHLAFDDKDLVMQVILFSPSLIWPGGPDLLDYEYLSPFEQSGSRFSNKLSHDHPHIGEITGVLDEIQKEYDLKKPHYQLMIKALLLKLLTNIIRYFDIEEGSCPDKRINLHDAKKLKEIAEYIEESFASKISLSDLSKKFNISISKLCRLFRGFSKFTPMEYIICLRVSAAKNELISTDKKIIEIAEDCGFGSVSNFNKCFKKLTGMSPREYRKR